MLLPEMLAQPILGLTDDRVCMRPTPDEARKRQLSIAMPLQQIDFGDVQRLSRAAMAGNDVDSEIVPGGRTPRGYNAPAVIGENDIGFRNKTDIWKTSAKEIRVTPVRCRRLAFEQAGRCQQHRTRTRRIDRIARMVALAEPFLQLRIALPQVFIGGKPKLRNDDDVRVAFLVDGQFRIDRNAVSARERIARERDDFRPDQPSAGFVADELTPQRAGRGEDVDQPVDRGPRG